MKNYDVFISYKHMDSWGNTTEDYAIAKQLYFTLKERGIDAFFSDESLFKLGKSDYKKAIDKALDFSKILIVIGTKKEYLYSGWIEYEYETFYEDILSGKKPDANIISYTKNILHKDLPRTLARLQNYLVDSMSFARIADYIENALKDDKSNTMIPERKPEVSASVPVKERRGSVYASDYRNELERLKIQAKNASAIDRQAIQYVFEELGVGPDEKICVLDVGSAYGFVAADRFGDDDRVGKILCIDNNERVIERAQIMFAENEKMIFEVVDVEDDEFLENMQAILERHGIEKIHIVFSALTLHHLKNPDRVLRKIRKLVDRGTYVILRGSDDGSKLCHPGYDLMEKIINMTLSATGVSDRLNGRKIYAQLLNSGFKDVRIFSRMKDISEFDYDDRNALFDESFSYRVHYFQKAAKANPEDEKAKYELKQMQKYLDEFENLFYENNFWYCEYDYLGIGRK